MTKIPKIAMIPSAYKASKVYSVLPTNGDADLDFARAGKATRVNEIGLIEEVASNVPRLDYSDGGCPVQLLEPERRNLYTNSEPTANEGAANGVSYVNFNWSLGFTNAAEFTSVGNFRYGGTVSENTIYTLSFFIIMDDLSQPIVGANSGEGDFSVIIGGTIMTSGFEVKNFGNNIYRVCVTGTSGTNTSNNGITKYNSQSSKGFKVVGLQLEQGSYATSYIPTSGSIATRDADVCNNGGNEQVFNDSEGVLYAEMSAFSETNLFEAISINNNSTSDRIFIGYFSDDLYITILDGGQAKYDVNTPINVKQNNKIAVKYKAQDFSFYLNGFEINASAGINGGTTPSGLSELSFNRGDGVEPFYGNIKQIKYFDKALTDQELIALTS